MSIFKPCFERFYETQVGLAKQTPAALNLAIIHFVENVLPMSLGSAGIGASVTSTPPAGYVALADVQDMIQQALAAHEARKPGASKAGAAQPNNRKSGPMYCWTHGPAHTHNGRDYGHTSQECKSPNQGHCHKATDGRRMGGTDVPAFYRYLEKKI